MCRWTSRLPLNFGSNPESGCALQTMQILFGGGLQSLTALVPCVVFWCCRHLWLSPCESACQLLPLLLGHLWLQLFSGNGWDTCCSLKTFSLCRAWSTDCYSSTLRRRKYVPLPTAKSDKLFPRGRQGVSYLSLWHVHGRPSHRATALFIGHQIMLLEACVWTTFLESLREVEQLQVELASSLSLT